MSVADVLAGSEPERDPDREGWRVMIATARFILPRGTVDELVTLAISLVPDGIAVDWAVVEQVALEMLFTAKDEG